MKQVCVLGPDGSGKTTLLPLLCLELERLRKNVSSLSTTQPIPGHAVSEVWRKQLVSENVTTFERFNAARQLYTANVSFYSRKIVADNQGLLDYLILDRGGSSMVTYNRIEHDDVFSLIPNVDIAVYLDSDFDTLTERINSRRKTSDFQDTNLEYRRTVHSQGPEDFKTWLTKSQKMRGKIYDTTNRKTQDLASELARWIVEGQ